MNGRLSFGTMLRFGIGQTGAQIVRDTPAVLLPVFMATMLGVPPWLGGFAVLVPKIWVMLCDPLMGMASDRWRLRIGRTPFLAVGAVVSSAGFVALFAVTDYPTPAIATLVVGAIYLLGVSGFSAFSVPYLAIASELSTDPHERTKLLTFRIVFAALGVILGVGFAQPVIRHFGGGAAGWHVMAAGFAGVCLATMLATAIGLRGVATPGAGGPAIGLGEQMRAAAGNRPFLVLVAVHFIQSLSQATSYAALGLVYLYVVGDVGVLIPFTLVMCGCGALSQPGWLALSRRIGKRPALVGSSLAFSALTVTWLWIRAGAGAVIDLPLFGPCGVDTLLILLRGALVGVLNQGFLLIITSMFTDTVEAGVRAGGGDNAGGLAGFWSASEKLAFAIGPVVGGAVLSASGFVASKGGAMAQSDAALHGVVLLYSLIPAALFLASLPLLCFYRLPDRRMFA